jgi:hypothetical protein
MVARQADSDSRFEPDAADRAITGSFALLRAAINDPDLLRSLPNDATVEFRDAVIDGHRFALVAACGPESDAWMARLFKHTPAEQPRLVDRSGGAAHDLGPDQIATLMAMRSHGLSHGAALDALEQNLTEVVSRALGEPGRSYDG